MKLDLAVIVASIVGAVVWIEHGRIDLETPAGPAFAEPLGAICPDNENAPYGAECIIFMQGDAAASDLRLRTAAKNSPAALPDTAGPACPPNNENVPYSANCIRFISGWFWRLNPP